MNHFEAILASREFTQKEKRLEETVEGKEEENVENYDSISDGSPSASSNLIPSQP